MRDAGLLTIYKLTNVAQPGLMPTEKLCRQQFIFLTANRTGAVHQHTARFNAGCKPL